MAHVGVNRALISGFEGRKLGDLLEIPQGYGQVYRKTDFIFDAMIVAAGVSSRMGEFKPLMEIGGKTVIRRQVETCLLYTSIRGVKYRKLYHHMGRTVCIWNSERKNG